MTNQRPTVLVVEDGDGFVEALSTRVMRGPRARTAAVRGVRERVTNSVCGSRCRPEASP